MRHFDESRPDNGRGRFREYMMMARGGGGGFGRGGFGGPFGFGDGEGGGRPGRFLGQGQIRLLVLHLIGQEPRHGYDIIKAIEEMSGGFYAPSPGVIYPTLSFLEEGGYVVAVEDGNKKRYSITDEGSAYLADNMFEASMAVKALSAIGDKMKRRRERRDAEGGPELPRSVEVAMLNLREVIARKVDDDPAAASEIVRALLEFTARYE
ncbi:PadR family transcriptional regulator [Martelella soudanensis]|uniref:PadR family transcriptional regulator n=1 Tax=unclassified Martelella TaxID=2629616 RepID=UPI0015DEBBD6|nr:MULTISPECIES: PadR family transcriptional regulator [unclassified Martelella]